MFFFYCQFGAIELSIERCSYVYKYSLPIQGYLPIWDIFFSIKFGFLLIAIVNTFTSLFVRIYRCFSDFRGKFHQSSLAYSIRRMNDSFVHYSSGRLWHNLISYLIRFVPYCVIHWTTCSCALTIHWPLTMTRRWQWSSGQCLSYSLMYLSCQNDLVFDVCAP